MTTYYVRNRTDPTVAPPNTSGFFCFFDGSDAAASDPGGVWTDETNADDMNIATVAYTTTAGSQISNELFIEGTNAPGTGDTISSVELWAYLGSGSVASSYGLAVWTDGKAELIGLSAGSYSTGWHLRVASLTTPTGGWTWAKIQALEVSMWNGHASNRLEVAAIGVLVHTTTEGQSATHPFRTIDEAANVVAAGDTVYVGAGTYREAVTMDTSGSSGNQISYIADVDGSQTGDPGLVVISAYTDSNTATRSLCWDPDGRTFITVRGFVMQGGTAGVVWDANATDQNYEGVIFEDCVFVAGPDGADEGMRLDANAGTTPTTDGLIVRRCTFYGSGIDYRWDGNATVEQNLKVIIEDNLFCSTHGSTLAAYSALNWDKITADTYGSGGVTFRNNTVVGFVVGVYVEAGTSTTYPVAASNNVFHTQSNCLAKQTTNDGALTSSYNTFHAVSPLSNVTAGTGDRQETSTWLLGGIADMPLYRFLGWSPYKPWEPMRPHATDDDWTSLIGDATTGPAVDLYNNPRPMAQAGTTRSIYYFDASDSGPTDNEGTWTNDANAFNGNISDFATNSATGSSTTNELRGTGTNAPNPLGGVVYSVRMRAYFTTPTGNWFFTVFHEGTSLVSVNSASDGWTSWQPVSVPSGGWTWAKVQALEIAFWSTNDTALQVHAAEIEVIHSAQLAPDRGAVEGRARPERETTTIDTGSTAVRFEGAGYHDMLVPVAAASTTVTVKARKDANYTGTAPQLVVMNIPGVADQTDTHAVAADTWDTLTVTFTPTAAGVARIRLLSSDTSASGRSFFDTLTVT